MTASQGTVAITRGDVVLTPPPALATLNRDITLRASLRRRPGIAATVALKPRYDCLVVEQRGGIPGTPGAVGRRGVAGLELFQMSRSGDGGDGNDGGNGNPGSDAPPVSVEIGRAEHPVRGKLVLMRFHSQGREDSVVVVEPGTAVVLDATGGKGGEGGKGGAGGVGGAASPASKPRCEAGDAGNGGNGGRGGDGAKGGRGAGVHLSFDAADRAVLALLHADIGGGDGGPAGAAGKEGAAGLTAQFNSNPGDCPNTIAGKPGRNGIPGAAGVAGEKGPPGPDPSVEEHEGTSVALAGLLPPVQPVATPLLPRSIVLSTSGAMEIGEGAPSRIDPRSNLRMVRIHAGTYRMGCASTDGDCLESQTPSRVVSVGSFWMDVTEVTVAAYARCVDAGVCTAPFAGAGLCNWGRRPDHPVNCVDWNQASSFCVWSGGRLPTAEEWEYAARGEGQDQIFPWGDSRPNGTRANYCDHNCPQALPPPDLGMYQRNGWIDDEEDDGWAGTAPVGSYPAGDTRQGLHDMAGNVWEWTSTRNESGQYQCRGGGLGSHWPVLKSCFWIDNTATHINHELGFRCVR